MFIEHDVGLSREKDWLLSDAEIAGLGFISEYLFFLERISTLLFIKEIL
jgi:hypothetical protein